LLDWLDRHSAVPVVLFFIALLVIGLASFRDYGISWDEPLQRKYGQHLYDFVTKGDLRMIEGPMKYYGPAFEMCLFFLQKALGLEDTRSIYFMRHLMTFLVFLLGVFFFYRLCRLIFRSWKVGLLGAAMLVLSPRIFAESFYNPKDMPFLALFVISIYTLVRYLDAKTIRWAVTHAIACAVLVDIRIVGLLVPLFTAGFVAADVAGAGRRGAHVVRQVLGFGVFGGVLAAAVVLMWPTLWQRPLYHLAQAFREMSHYPQDAPVLYLGQYTQPRDLPWHYGVVWIGISTPLLYIVGFLLGCLVLLRRASGGLIRHNIGVLSGRFPEGLISGRDSAVLLLWFFFPVLYVMLSRATLFDGWRHIYFVYPAFVGIALVGFCGAFRFLRGCIRSGAFRIVATIVVVAVTLGMLNIARIMFKYHPYEHLYFNVLAGGIRGAEGRFDLDYWGLSYRQALEHILRIDGDAVIPVCVHTRPGRVNAEILPVQDRQRLVFETNPYDAEYYLTSMRWEKVNYLPEQIVREIYVDGARIMVAVKVVR
jgi:hypothetical protein